MNRDYFRRGPRVVMSPEAKAAFRMMAAWPVDFHGLAGEVLKLHGILVGPVDGVPDEVLAGVATAIDLCRLLIAAMPAATGEDLGIKRMALADREPLLPGADLMPLLLDAALRADEYRLGLGTAVEVSE